MMCYINRFWKGAFRHLYQQLLHLIAFFLVGLGQLYAENWKRDNLVGERVEHIGGFSADTLETKYGIVRFEQGNGRYGFDLGAEKWYQKTTLLDTFYKPFGKGYIAPWKLIPVGEQDEVIAKYEGRNISNLRAIRFASSPNSTSIPAEFDERTKTWKLTLPATDAHSSYNVFALYEGKVIGKLRVVSYPKQSYRVRLVPVNGQSVGDVSALSQRLNDIYNQYGVSFRLYEGEGMTAQFSPSNLKSELRELNKQYQQAHTLTSEEVCIFVLSEELGKGSRYEEVEGLMPRGSRFGYIFAGNSPNEDKLARTLAHELGHGLFTLRHTSAATYGRSSRRPTANLMDDQPQGVELAAYQWNIMASPAPFTALDRQRDAQLLRKDAVWLTPDWEPFVCNVSNGITRLSKPIVNGSIGGIYYKGQLYEYASSFKGYVNAQGGHLPISRPQSVDSVHLVNQNEGECGTVYLGSWSDLKSVANVDFVNNSSLRYVQPVGCYRAPSPDWSEGNTSLYFLGESSAYQAKVLDLLTQELSRRGDTNVFTQRAFSGDVCLAVRIHGTDLVEDDELSQLQSIYKNVVVVEVQVGEDGSIRLVDLSLAQSFAQNNALERIQRLLQEQGLWYAPAILLYEVADLMVQGVQYLKIPEDVWGCSGNGTPIYKEVVSTILETALGTILLPDHLKPSAQAQFAFMCGLWNGLVEVVESVPQLAKFVTCVFHPDCRSEVSTQWESFKSMVIKDEQGRVLCDSSAYLCKVKELVMASLEGLVSDDCKLSHTAGTIVGPMVALCVGDVSAAGVAVKNLGSVSQGVGKALQFLQFCDRITDVLSPLLKSGRWSIALIKKGGGQLLPEIRQGSRRVLAYVDDRLRLFSAKHPEGVSMPESALVDGTLDHELWRSIRRQEHLSNLEATPAYRSLSGADQSLVRQSLEQADDASLEDSEFIQDLITSVKERRSATFVDQMRRGQAFNRERSAYYRYNEIYVIDPRRPNAYVRLDSYTPNAEIVSRKFTQLGEVSEATAIKYLKELADKYPEGATIANVPSNLTGRNKGIFEANGGNKLQGKMILEVPVQTKPIPQSVIDYANQYEIKIRDTNNLIYNP